MVKFEGIVNGVEYSSVEDYNAAVTKALENGGLVSASSNTYTVEDTNEETEQSNKDCEEYEKMVKKGLLPYYNLDNIDDDTMVKYLNSLENNIIVDYIKNNFNDSQLRMYKAELHGLREERREYFKSNLKLKRILEEKREEIDNKLNSLLAEKDELDKKFDICSKANKVLHKELETYNKISANLPEMLPDSKNESIKIKTEMKEVTSQKEEQVDSVDKLGYALNKLFDTIFK